MSESKHTPVAWMHEDGRVIPASTMDRARKDGGADLSSVSGYTTPLYARAPDLAGEAENTIAAERRKAAEQGRNAVELFDGCKRLQAENADLSRKVEVLREALRPLWPVIEHAMAGLVFTGDKACEVAAQMSAVRAALAASEQKGGA